MKLELPPKGMRYCWSSLKDDKNYMLTAISEANRLIRNCGLNKDSSVLDIGCGQGRLAYGIHKVLGTVEKYVGIDVNLKSVKHCKEEIESKLPNFRFIHLDLKNKRYNPKGSIIKSGFRLPLEDESFDVINLYSVFTHMMTDAVKKYINEIHRMLKVGGKAFFTIFVHTKKKTKTVKDSRPLYRVYHNIDLINSIIKDAGLKIEQFYYNCEMRGQSIYYVTKDA